ncbi:SDR family NAD(P)-dependent oxidoreductase [Amycolatopsis ultiminotia]|uniref:SDR family NAD(P)-dependent oxidoreductase n=1 Tax=Amycolatopsis ultiminotia TaxID=543629 RepID=A0ABP6XD37_9PSEU
MQQPLSNKRALVTGGTKGIGRAIALALARGGATVVACYHSDEASAAELARELKEHGDGHQVRRADVTDSGEVESLLAGVRDTLGGLDVLVNNVGVDGVAWFSELSQAEWTRVMTHNVDSAFVVTQAALELLSDGSSIVNVGSSVALRGRARGVHYTTSKAALIGFTRALAKDVGERGIRVNLVAPGLTETEPGAGLPAHMVERIVGMTALKRLGQPEDVAEAVAFLAGDASRYVTGATLTVDGGV